LLLTKYFLFFILLFSILFSGCSHRVEKSKYWEKRLKQVHEQRADKKADRVEDEVYEDEVEEEEDRKVNEFDEDDVDKSKKIRKDDDGVVHGEQPEASTILPPSSLLNQASMRSYKVNGASYFPALVEVGTKVKGKASWYGPDFNGKKTSNGEIYDMYEYTAAHKTLPMNTIVKVHNRRNGKIVNVRINDRGPFVKNRIIDLSKAAAKAIDMTQKGTADVEIEVLGFNRDPKDQKKAKKVSNKESLYVRKMKNYFVQIGSFSNKLGALAYQKKFEQVGDDEHNAIIKESEQSGKKTFRVVISGFNSNVEAREYIKAHPGFRSAFVVRD